MVKLLNILILILPILIICNGDEKEYQSYMKNLYGENKEITDDYDESLSIKCNNGIFVGLKEGNVISFKGIPFAKPPINDLRWKDPVLPEDSTKVYQAYYFGRSPIQEEWPNQLGSYYPQSEDCLYLNVWVNTKDTSTDKAVIVFIFGGSYANGATADPIYDGHNLVEKYPDIIFVSIAYRLNILGFINFSSVPGGENYKTTNNLGLLDQICALKYIQKNIKNFGGDPEKVTLMGQSSGGSSIILLSLLDESKGLFKRIISESGSLALTFSTDETKELTKQLLEKTGAKNMDDLLKLSEEELIKIENEISSYSNYAERDGNIIPYDLYSAFQSSNIKDIDILTGSNKDEVRFWMNSLGYYSDLISGKFAFRHGIPILYESDLKKISDEDKEYIDEFMNLLNDRKIWKITEFYNEMSFRIPMTKQAELHSNSGGNTYVYYWTYPGEDEELGAFHNFELAYTLNNLQHTFHIGNKVNNELANKVQDMWINFARNGNPSTSEITWEKYNTDTRKTMIIDEKIEMVENLKDEQREILEPLLKYYLNGNFAQMSYNVPQVYRIVLQLIGGLSILFLIFWILKSLISSI